MIFKKLLLFLAIVLLIGPTSQRGGSGGSGGSSSGHSGDSNGGTTHTTANNSRNNKAYYHTGSVITVIIIGSAGEHSIIHSDQCPIPNCLVWDPAGKRCATELECEDAKEPMSLLAKIMIGVSVTILFALCCVFCYYKREQDDDFKRRD